MDDHIELNIFESRAAVGSRFVVDQIKYRLHSASWRKTISMSEHTGGGRGGVERARWPSQIDMID